MADRRLPGQQGHSGQDDGIAQLNPGRGIFEVMPHGKGRVCCQQDQKKHQEEDNQDESSNEQANRHGRRISIPIIGDNIAIMALGVSLDFTWYRTPCIRLFVSVDMECQGEN